STTRRTSGWLAVWPSISQRRPPPPTATSGRSSSRSAVSPKTWRVPAARSAASSGVDTSRAPAGSTRAGARLASARSSCSSLTSGIGTPYNAPAVDRQQAACPHAAGPTRARARVPPPFYNYGDPAGAGVARTSRGPGDERRPAAENPRRHAGLTPGRRAPYHPAPGAPRPSPRERDEPQRDPALPAGHGPAGAGLGAPRARRHDRRA